MNVNFIPMDSDDDEVEIIATIAEPSDSNTILSWETDSNGVTLPRGRGRPVIRDIKFVASPGDPFIGTESFIHFVVRGKPTPKARAAPGINGTMYNPSKDDEADIKDVVQKLCIHHLSEVKTYFAKPQRIKAVFQLCFPNGDNTDLVDHADVDNMVKFYQDAVNRLFYDDDGQVCSLLAEKDFSDMYGGQGYVVITFKKKE